MYSQPARVYRVVSRSGKIYAPDKLIVEISSVRYRPMARVNGPTTLSRSEVIVNKSAPPTPEHSSAGHLLHGPSDTTVTAVRWKHYRVTAVRSNRATSGGDVRNRYRLWTPAVAINKTIRRQRAGRDLGAR